jgi:hypothetical protein
MENYGSEALQRRLHEYRLTAAVSGERCSGSLLRLPGRLWQRTVTRHGVRRRWTHPVPVCLGTGCPDLEGAKATRLTLVVPR